MPLILIVDDDTALLIRNGCTYGDRENRFCHQEAIRTSSAGMSKGDPSRKGEAQNNREECALALKGVATHN